MRPARSGVSAMRTVDHDWRAPPNFATIQAGESRWQRKRRKRRVFHKASGALKPIKEALSKSAIINRSWTIECFRTGVAACLRGRADDVRGRFRKRVPKLDELNEIFVLEKLAGEAANISASVAVLFEIMMLIKAPAAQLQQTSQASFKQINSTRGSLRATRPTSYVC